MASVCTNTIRAEIARLSPAMVDVGGSARISATDPGALAQ
jgi:hypothetical protein